MPPFFLLANTLQYTRAFCLKIRSFHLLACLAEIARFLTVSFIGITEDLIVFSVIRKHKRASLELLVAAVVPHPLHDTVGSHHDRARMDQRQGRTSRRGRHDHDPAQPGIHKRHTPNSKSIHTVIDVTRE